MTKNIEYLTTLDVIRAIRDRRATITDYGEGVGKLLDFKNKVYYQDGDKFYRIHKEEMTKKLVENTQIKPINSMKDLSGKVIESNKAINDLTKSDQRTEISHKSNHIL